VSPIGNLYAVSDTVSNYLRDLGREVVEPVSHTSDDVAFELGRRTALYEVVTLMMNQAVAFGLTDEDVGLLGVDPERDVLGSA
jgi:hypothetical protein